MSSGDEKESFVVTDRDLLDELQPKRLFQSKNKATYGIWADESDDEGEVRRGFGGKKVPDYAAAMNFVSGGLKGEDRSKEPITEDVDDDAEIDKGGTSSESEEEILTRPAAGSDFSFSTGSRTDSSFGNWEKYTKGIGAKLLQKMGHVAGKGLGKNSQGILNPVEANKNRKGRGTIGMYGTEKTSRTQMREQRVDSEEEEDNEFQQKLNQWKKGDEGNKITPKYVYRTADEIIAKGSSRKLAPESGMSNVKVIDMTGREKRVLTGYRALTARHDKPQDESEDLYVELKPMSKVFDMPELIHNLDLLVDMAEDEIIQHDKKVKHAKDMVVTLKYEQEKITDVVEREKKQIDRLQTIVSIIDSMKARIDGLSVEPLSFEECASTFKFMKESYYEEFMMYDIPILAVVIAKPMMRLHFNNWRPLNDKHYGLEIMGIWKEILFQEETSRFGYTSEITDPYDSLMWDVWMPQMRGVISNCAIRDCDSLIELIEIWSPLLSPWIINNILAQLILPKIHDEVEQWNPLTDTVPIHAWIHPWLPLMGTRLEPVFEPIRLKLGSALKNWHPSDPSARLIIQPWVTVFSKGHLDAFLIKHIVPKLHMCMSEFIINPHQQHLDTWNWVVSWKGLVPLHTMIALLDKTFFPKWHQVLTTWLNADPNFEEIAKWFSGWKTMMPDEMMVSPVVKDHFSQALKMMNRAVTGKGHDPSILSRDRDSPRTTPPPPAPPIIKPSMSGVPQSFKELVLRKAEEHDLLFVPAPNRYREGKQVYKFGKAQIYLDRNVIFVNDDGTWTPVSLNTLVEYGNGK